MSHHSVSIVISTLNRGPLLRNCLHSLRYQNYPAFEVIVVNGPSTDNTDEVLADFARDVRVARVDVANLSVSRNAGIALATGSLVLFLDDDAYPEPDWISTIVSGYDRPDVGGVGTRVYDPSGFAWQTNPFTVDQFYRANFERRPPVWAFEFPDSLTIPHILGASSSFRTDLLHRLGGFDEEIEYFLDESEVCRRVAELGFRIRFLDHGASVHHKFAAGVTRDETRILKYPYPVVKNKYYVTVSDCLRHGRNLSEAIAHCDTFVTELMDGARWQLAHSGISSSEFKRFSEEVRRGQTQGLQKAGASVRKSHVFEPLAEPGLKSRFATFQPAGGRKSFCFISRYSPRRSPGGVARFMFDLASGFAARGHDVHLITLREGPSEVEYDNGLWIHHLSQAQVLQVAERVGMPPLGAYVESGAGRMNIAWAQAAHGEVMRLRSERYIDLVVAPAWDQEGLFCALDPSLTTVVSMNTTFRTYAEIERGAVDAATRRELTTLETLYLGAASSIHANSTATARHVQEAFGLPRPSSAMTVGHGCRDAAAQAVAHGMARRRTAAETPKLLYVSRLERRKGTDTFFSALQTLIKVCPELQVRVVGRDAYAGDPQRSYLSRLSQEWPHLTSNVTLLGEISDAALAKEYEQADIFCVPSRYESFGIIYLEAMRYGLPVVATAVGGITDIVLDGQTGLLVPPDQPAALSQALQRLAQDRDLRIAMGEQARQRFVEHFEHEVIIDRTLDAFSKAIAQSAVVVPTASPEAAHGV